MRKLCFYLGLSMIFYDFSGHYWHMMAGIRYTWITLYWHEISGFFYPNWETFGSELNYHIFWSVWYSVAMGLLILGRKR